MAGKAVGALTDIEVVYVSPLRRTIHTAIEAFKDHPDPSRIKFVVHPLLREMT